MDNNLNEKNSKGLIVLIVILSLLVVGLTGYLVYYKFIKPEPICTKCDVKTDDKTKNELEITNETSDDSISDDENDRWYLDITISQNKVKIVNNLATENPDLGMDNEAELTFDKNVKSFFRGTLSNNMGDIYFFLMEDGTVEYMRYSDIYLRNNYTHKTIEGVTDVVKIEQENIVDEENSITKYRVLAYKSDGSTYDLNNYNLFEGDGVPR